MIMMMMMMMMMILMMMIMMMIIMMMMVSLMTMMVPRDYIGLVKRVKENGIDETKIYKYSFSHLTSEHLYNFWN